MIDRLAQLVGRGHGIDTGIDTDTGTDHHAGPARRVRAAIKQKAPTSAAGTAERARRHASRPSCDMARACERRKADRLVSAAAEGDLGDDQ